MPATLIDKLVQTIASTLLHSLWQGLLLTVLAVLTARFADLLFALSCFIFFKGGWVIVPAIVSLVDGSVMNICEGAMV